LKTFHLIIKEGREIRVATCRRKFTLKSVILTETKLSNYTQNIKRKTTSKAAIISTKISNIKFYEIPEYEEKRFLF
jgi:hypothetical protein